VRLNDASLPRPLAGCTILDLTTALAGPYATLLLAGLGATVIKIENPLSPDSARGNAPFLGRDGVSLAKRHPDDIAMAMLERGRNKQAITLNLKDPRGKALFFDLVEKADAIVENYSAGVADRLGIGFAEASKRNPRIVYTAISGFGADRKPKQNKAMDAIVQAMSGLMMTSGAANDPPVRVGAPFGDLSAPLFAVIGTLAALMQARETGIGQFVDVSLLGVLSAMVATEPFEIMERLGQPYRTGNQMARLAPFGVFATTDGHMAICAPADNFAAGLFEAMGRADLGSDPRFSHRDARVANHVALHALVADWLGTMTTDAAFDFLAAHGVPCGPVRSPGTAKRDPDRIAREETVKLEHPIYGATDDDLYISGFPVRMSASQIGFDQPAPGLGEHNLDIYHDLLGLSEDRIAELIDDKVI
jgi:CoA:oxalate CoA-transferase